MMLRILPLLLASAILLTPRPSVSESPRLLTPSTCDAASSSPELPLFSQPDSVSLSFPPLRIKCGSCGACPGLYANDQCGVAAGGQIKRCRAATPDVCSQDGLTRCVCSIYDL